MLRARIVKRLVHFTLDVELACPASSILALTGPSGAGKTTLLRILAGLDAPDEGRIELDGEVWLDSDKGLLRRPQERGVGLVFQEYSLFPHMTLAQNVAYATGDHGFSRELMESFGIAHLASARPGRMSGGERQRGALCQALARRPKALLLDEPFSALDAATRAGLRRELLRVRQTSGLPIVHVTHDLAEAALLGDQVLALNNGRVDPGWFDHTVAERLAEEDVLRTHCRRRSAAAHPQTTGAIQ
jgi:molybdate transport system ATP-binding protein